MDLLAIGFQYVSALMVDALKIFQSPSPNFGNRRDYVTPKMVVLHYTAMKSSDDAIARMSDPKSEVSAHYLIDKFGKIIQLVDEQKRAWHAGRGCWGEINDVNSHSIGIELDYYPSIDESFDKRQLSSLNNLLFDILKRRPEIIPKSIIGHSDMAPERKRDPGKNFPWKKLSDKGLSIWPENVLDNGDVDWPIFKHNANIFGYRSANDTIEEWLNILDVFRLRFLPEQVGNLSPIDMGTMIALAKDWPHVKINNSQ